MLIIKRKEEEFADKVHLDALRDNSVDTFEKNKAILMTSSNDSIRVSSLECLRDFVSFVTASAILVCSFPLVSACIIRETRKLRRGIRRCQLQKFANDNHDIPLELSRKTFPQMFEDFCHIPESPDYDVA